MIACPCGNGSFNVLDQYGDYFDDHETMNCRCRSCGALYIATVWKIDRPTELRRMPAMLAKRYEHYRVPTHA